MKEQIQMKLNDSPFARWAALLLVASTMFFAYMFVDMLSPLKELLDTTLNWNSTTFGTYAASEYFLNVFCFFLIFQINDAHSLLQCSSIIHFTDRTRTRPVFKQEKRDITILYHAHLCYDDISVYHAFGLKIIRADI